MTGLWLESLGLFLAQRKSGSTLAAFKSLSQGMMFFATSPIHALISAYMCLASHYHRWHGKDFFPNSYAVARNRTHVSSVAPLRGTLTRTLYRLSYFGCSCDVKELASEGPDRCSFIIGRLKLNWYRLQKLGLGSGSAWARKFWARCPSRRPKIGNASELRDVITTTFWCLAKFEMISDLQRLVELVKHFAHWIRCN